MGLSNGKDFFLFLSLLVLGVEPRVLNMLCKCSTTELHLNIFNIYLWLCVYVCGYMCASVDSGG